MRQHNHPNIIIIACAALTVLLLLGLTAILRATPEPPPPKTGTSLQGMRLYDLSGHQFDIAQVKSGRVVVICWAFWCDTWKKALPHIQELAAEQNELDCTVLTMSIDGRYTEEIRPLVEANKIPFPVLLDDGAWTTRLGLRRVPTVLLLDKQRTVVWLREGYPGNAVLEKAIRAVKDDKVSG